jgi:hypothetical protein
MDHNKFDYENDLLFPLKDFLKRNTHFNPNDLTNIQIPGYLFDVPSHLKQENSTMDSKEQTYGCFGAGK